MMKDKLNNLINVIDKKNYKEEMVFWSSTSTENVDFKTRKALADGLFKKINQHLASFDNSIDLNITFDPNLSKKKTLFSIEEISHPLKIAHDVYQGLDDSIITINLSVGHTSVDMEIKFNEYLEPHTLKARIQMALKKNASAEKGPFKNLECYISGQKDGNGISLKFSTDKKIQVQDTQENTKVNDLQSMDRI